MLSIFSPAGIVLVLVGIHIFICISAFVTPPTPPASAAYSLPKQYQWRITQQQQRLSRILLAGKNKYGNDNKLSQAELLLNLESKVDDYEGNIPSKVVDTGDDDTTTTALTSATKTSS